MAKVMISMPDDLLEALDRRAAERGTTRSGLLQEFTRRELRPAADLVAMLEDVFATPMKLRGMTAAEEVRRDRERA